MAVGGMFFRRVGRPAGAVGRARAWAEERDGGVGRGGRDRRGWGRRRWRRQLMVMEKGKADGRGLSSSVSSRSRRRGQDVTGGAWAVVVQRSPSVVAFVVFGTPRFR